MINAENLQTEPYTIEDMQHEGDLTGQVEQQERGQFMSFIGRVAGRVALVGAIAGSVLVGQNYEEAEAAPAPQAPVSCTKNGQQGIRLGSLCVTRQEVRRSGACSKADEIIGEAALAAVIFALPVANVVSAGAGFGWTSYSILNGGFCD